MGEVEPHLLFNLWGENYRADWGNCYLYTHRQIDREFDHIFLQHEVDEETAQTLGTFIFRHVLDNFDDVANFLVENDFFHVHKPYVSEMDREHGIKSMTYDLGDEPPEGWV